MPQLERDVERRTIQRLGGRADEEILRNVGGNAKHDADDRQNGRAGGHAEGLAMLNLVARHFLAEEEWTQGQNTGNGHQHRIHHNGEDRDDEGE